MGLMLHASCDCGFIGSACAGSGRDEGSATLPVLCRHCRDVTSVWVDRSRLKCSRCGRKPELYEVNDPRAQVEALDEAQRYECPQCGQHRLRFEPMGLWD